MREPVRDKGRLEHILEAIGRVEGYTKDISRSAFNCGRTLHICA